MKTALKSRHIGRVIRAYRTHPHHGRHPLAQETVAAWLCTTQPRLSRIENGPGVDQLDLLIHWARVLRIPEVHLWFALPDDDHPAKSAALTSEHEEGQAEPDLGAASSARTRVLLEAVQTGESGLRHLPPFDAVDGLMDFLRSSSRVFVVKGPAGSGKTSLTYYLASGQAEHADFQLHSIDSWNTRSLDLAAEILRYASTPRGEDALLTLEQAGSALRRPCLVVIDGVKTQAKFSDVGRQLDGVLRQVTSDKLRFLLVVRTPPDIEMSVHPVLNASVYTARESGTSYHLSPWDPATAQDVWNRSRAVGDPAFSDLPPSIQRLARLPLYMQLLKAADRYGSPGEVNAYRLIDFCVRSILRESGQDVEQAVRELADMAHREFPELVPAQVSPAADRGSPRGDGQQPPSVPPLIVTTAGRHPTFGHDVVAEYFLATRIANLMVERGRTSGTVAAFNSLATQAGASATARGVFELVVNHLDGSAPDLLAAVALSPTIGVGTTLPLMLNLAGDGAFATDDVLRACATRCSRDSSLELSRSLVAMSDTARALGDEYVGWLIGLLRRFGSAIWSDVVSCVEQVFDALTADRLLSCADLEETREATFFARYFFLFFGDDHEMTGALQTLLEHPDWRVRAALAEGLRDHRSSPSAPKQLIVDRLARDIDYKVRAMVARAIGSMTPPLAERHLTTLLADENWHVRGSALQGIMPEDATPSAAGHLADVALKALASDGSWRQCPAHVEPLMHRLSLLHGVSSPAYGSNAGQHALFTLLRELRTGWLRLPEDAREGLVSEARASGHWLVRREVEFLTDSGEPTWRPSALTGALRRREAFRRLRDHRSIQVALDLHDLDHAVSVATAVAAAGVDFIEVGDPLIKKAGLGAIEHVKRHVQDTAVVAEMMSADWGRDQVETAVQAGADIVLLIGPATVASVSAATDAARRLDVPILLDVPALHLSEQWIRDMERAGVDGFTVTTNIDLGVRGGHPLTRAREIRHWSRLPVAVSGGFSASDHSLISSPDWDIMIVGRSITEAVNPARMAGQMAALVHKRQTKGAR